MHLNKQCPPKPLHRRYHKNFEKGALGPTTAGKVKILFQDFPSLIRFRETFFNRNMLKMQKLQKRN